MEAVRPTFIPSRVEGVTRALVRQTASRSAANPQQSPRLRLLLDEVLKALQTCENELGTYPEHLENQPICLYKMVGYHEGISSDRESSETEVFELRAC